MESILDCGLIDVFNCDDAWMRLDDEGRRKKEEGRRKKKEAPASVNEITEKEARGSRREEEKSARMK